MIYILNDYLFVCERHPFLGVGGCGIELLVKQRKFDAACEYAENEGWYIFKPSPIDDDRTHQAICPSCKTQWEMIKARRVAKWEMIKARREAKQ